jgi:hypothetical protein
MSAKLEKYLGTHRKELDVESPDDTGIWKGIEKELHHKPSGNRYLPGRLLLKRIWNIAAVVFIFFSLGYIANDIINGRYKNRKITLSSIDSQLGRREKEYKTLVRYKTEEVSSFAGSEDVIIKELFKEIKDLDPIYDQALKDLKELGPNDKVINTIFDTYEQKIRLLELIILETNKIKSHENNEKIIL